MSEELLAIHEYSAMSNKLLWVSCFKTMGFAHYFHMRFSYVLWLEEGLLVVTTTREIGNMREVVRVA
jgi:hypothetical protein